MDIILANKRRIPFVFGMEATKAAKGTNALTAYLEWKKKATSEGLDVSEVTLEVFKQEFCKQVDGKYYYEDEDKPFMFHYNCYVAGCKIEKSTPVEYDEFSSWLDEADFNQNLRILADAVSVMSKPSDDGVEKNG